MPATTNPDVPIHELVRKRVSPYAFADAPVSAEDLRALFEAARWAPSSYNEQPWRYIVATRAQPGEFARLLDLLVPGNQVWARHVPVLALGLTVTRFARNDRENAAADHDLGLASAHLTFEATSRGLVVHQMIGIEVERIRESFALPDHVRPLTGLAIGHAGNGGALSDELRARDEGPRERRPVDSFVYHGAWERPLPW